MSTTTATTARPGTAAEAPAATLTPPRGARRVTRADMSDAVAERVALRYNSSAVAVWVTAEAARDALRGWACRLDPDAAAEAAEHLAGLDDAAPVYVVVSYNTPCALDVPGRGWWVWGTRYSATTGTHLNAVRRAMTPAERAAAGLD